MNDIGEIEKESFIVSNGQIVLFFYPDDKIVDDKGIELRKAIKIHVTQRGHELFIRIGEGKLEFRIGRPEVAELPKGAITSIRDFLGRYCKVSTSDVRKLLLDIKDIIVNNKKMLEYLNKKDERFDESEEGIELNGAIKLGENAFIVTRSDWIWLVDAKGRGRRVFSPPFEVKAELDVDGMVLYEISTPRRDYRGTASELLKYLREEGIVVYNRVANDVLNALLQFTDKEEIEGHAAIGVYERNNFFELVLEPFTVTRDQEVVRRWTSEAVKEGIDADKLSKWLEIVNFWHPYELFPCMGLAAMAPFSLVVRRRGRIFPHLFHVSPETGLGKTEMQRIFSERLYGVKEVQSNAIASAFRF
ncbi:hypothetical protein DRP04_14825, partial [Archaeoglobales archaeon]